MTVYNSPTNQWCKTSRMANKPIEIEITIKSAV